MSTIENVELKLAKLGSVSEGTLRTEDLISAFADELCWQIRRNGEYFSLPENFGERDRLNNLVGEANDLFGDDGETIPIDNEYEAAEMVNETLPDALQAFAPPYSYFRAHQGDGSDFGFWPQDMEEIKEQVGFDSTVDNEYPPDDFAGEWLHINERGNCTLYVRTDGKDVEVWGVV